MRIRTYLHFLLVIVPHVVITNANVGQPLYTCVDWDCDDWISKGKTLLTYVAKTEKHLSFKKNADIYIIGKPVDKGVSDWVAKIGDKVGLVPKDYVREDKMNKNTPKFKLSLNEIPAFAENEEEEQENNNTIDGEDDEEDDNEAGVEIEDIDVSPTELEASLEPSISTESLDPSISVPPVEPPVSSAAPESSISIPVKISISSVASEEPSFSPTPVVEPSISPTPLEPSVVLPTPIEPSVSILPVEPSASSASLEPSIAPTPAEPSISPTPVDPSSASPAEELSSSSTPQELTEQSPVSLQTHEPPIPPSSQEPSIILPTEESSFSPPTQESSIAIAAEEPTSSWEPSIIAPKEEKSSCPHSQGPSISHSAEDPSESSTPLEPSIIPPSEETSPHTLEHSIFNPPEEPSSTSILPEPSIVSQKEESLIPLHTQEPSIPQRPEEPLLSSPQEPVVTPPADQLSSQKQESAIPEESTITPPTEESSESFPPQEPSISLHSEQPSIPIPQEKPSIPLLVEEPSMLVKESPVPPEQPSIPAEEPSVLPEQPSIPAEEPSVSPEEPSIPVKELPVPPEEPSISPEELSIIPEELSIPPTEPSISVEESSTSPPPQVPPIIPPVAETPVPFQAQEASVPHSPEELASSSSLQEPSIPPAEESPMASHTPDQEPSIVQPVEESVSSPAPQELSIPAAPEEALVKPSTEEPPVSSHDHGHSHDHHHHHHHHHGHGHRHHFRDVNDTEASSIILVIKHLSSTLLSFLPEALQDTILDVDDALVFTGIIALTLVSICVPYFLIEGYMSVRPLKKKVVELNKSLWKVSAAYETQQEEFEIFKQKAIAHDEFKKRAEQSENDVLILKKLETKHREQITALKTQLKQQMKEAVDIRALIEKTLEDKKIVVEECDKYKAAYETTKEALVSAREELNRAQHQAKSSALLLNTTGKNTEVLTAKISMLEQQGEDMKAQLATENERRKAVEAEKKDVEKAKAAVEKELTEFKSICHQYEQTVSGLNDEISKLESELSSIKETLGDDSPLLEIAEVQAKAAFLEKESDSLRTRLEGLTADNENLNGKLKETANALQEMRAEREQTNNRLQVLEKYFKEREEEYIKTIEQLQLKESVRDKGKEELIRIIEEKDNVCKDLNERLEALKEEFEETKQQHRNEIRALEAKGHENWLSLCQAERKAQDARKEAKLLRQRLTELTKEKDDDDGDGLNGEVPMFPILPDELVPLPIMDEPPSYFGLGDFVPPPPLPEGGEREPHRPPPLGGLGGRLSPSFSDFDDNILSPIGVGRREDDCTDGSSGSDSPRRSPALRGNWVNVPHDREGQGRESMRRITRATSSPIQPGANL